MDWKHYYENELLSPGSHDQVTRWLREADDPRVRAAIDRNAILSFPHTALAFAGPLQTAVVSGLYRSGVRDVIALGVLHSGFLPAYRTALDEKAPLADRDRAFGVVRGGFALPQETARTPFGDLPLLPADGPVRVDRSGILDKEFSLDTFLATMALAAAAFDRPCLPVLPVFVGMTRDPVRRVFGPARELAEWLSCRIGPRTALVTTGDLVHFGATYGWTPHEIEAAGRQESVNRALREGVARMLSLALEGQTEAAYQANLRSLRNDQREILPVLAAYLRHNAGFELLAFEMSDYEPILEAESPCLVASALVAYG